MWFEILPPCAIITIALSIPGFATYHLNKAICGNVRKIFNKKILCNKNNRNLQAFRRNVDDVFDRQMYRRDYRLNKDVYNQQVS